MGAGDLGLGEPHARYCYEGPRGLARGAQLHPRQGKDRGDPMNLNRHPLTVAIWNALLQMHHAAQVEKWKR
jgi:hypothetical protein